MNLKLQYLYQYSISHKIIRIQIISQVIDPNLLYSDSIEDLETMFCFLLLHETRDFSIKIQ